MISEVLLVLGGHRSSIFLDDTTLHPSFSDLHPGERQCLEYLARIGFRYQKIKAACRSLLQTSKSTYICTACATLAHTLKEYENTVVQTESRVLRRDVELVATGAFVPLSSIRAIFSEWDAPLSALLDLMTDLGRHEERLSQNSNSSDESRQRGPGPLIDMLMARTATGVHKISDIMSQISISVQRTWIGQLMSYLHGHLSSSGNFAATDHTLLDGSLPACVSVTSRESIVYIGRAVGTINAAKYKHQLPRSMILQHALLLENVLPEDQHAFDAVIAEIRSQVSNHLWLTVLTRADVEEAVNSLSDYFLLRNGEFSLAFIRELERLKLARLKATSPSASIIREQDILRALLRASLGTTAQHDPALSRIRAFLPSGPLRPLLPSLGGTVLTSSQSSKGRDSTDPFLFTSQLLGTPLFLSYHVTFPLDLFLDKAALDVYAALFGYLSGIRRIHTRIHDCWESLSNAQRQRRVWTGLSEGGTAEDLEARKQLLRCGWGVVRDMSWFLDTLLGYTMIDVVASEYDRFKGILNHGLDSTIKPSHSRSSLPPSTSTPSLHSSTPLLDFTTLRRLHSDYLERLLNGCLLTSPGMTIALRGIFEVCERFVAQVERWGGDILPALLSEGTDAVGALVQERWKIVEEINDALHSHFDEFWDELSSSISGQPYGSADASRSMLLNSHFGSMTEPNLSKTGKGLDGALADTRRHVERLMLRLDFNIAHHLRRTTIPVSSRQDPTSGQETTAEM